MKANDCRFEWNGLFVRKESFERRQPQDLLRGFPDKQAAAVSRPGTADVWIKYGTIWDDGETIWDNGETEWDQ